MPQRAALLKLSCMHWIHDACARLTGRAPTLVELAAWLGTVVGDDSRLFVARPPAVEADHVLVLAESGAPTSLTAGFAMGAGPLLHEVERALGRARELPRGPYGPFQMAFPGVASAFAHCSIAGTTYDPPLVPVDRRRLVELTLRRDPV